jgi:hypothetical protein
MPVNTPFRSSPELGPQINEVYATVPYYDTQTGASSGTTTYASPTLGDKSEGTDGGEYYWVQASALVAATATTGTQVTITFPGYTIAAGAGGFYTPVNTAVPSGGYCWVRRGAWNALPA